MEAQISSSGVSALDFDLLFMFFVFFAAWSA